MLDSPSPNDSPNDSLSPNDLPTDSPNNSPGGGVTHGRKNVRALRAITKAEQLSYIAQKAEFGLPGITPGRQVIQTYKNSNVAQTSTQGDAAGMRVDLTSVLRVINDERISLQLAADAEWPHTNPLNIPIRREFLLPTRSGFNV